MNIPQTQWYIYLDSAHDPFYNMAMDETLLQEAEKIAIPLIRIYDWDRPSTSIGYVQRYDAVANDKHTIVRRPTGGGVVYHDHDLTYTAVVPADNPICKLNRIDSYHVFHEAILQTLSEFGLEGSLSPDECGSVDRATMQCFTTPTRYDVVAAGKKYAGAAQRRTKTGILHQGSINLEVLECDKKLLTKKLLTAFEKQFNMQFIDFKPDSVLLKQAMELAEKKYATDNWNKHKKVER
jgi:lipoyl(octanoyl) transferase